MPGRKSSWSAPVPSVSEWVSGLRVRPSSTREKQAVAAVGQCELMFIYDKLFGEYNGTVAQVLLTRDIMENDHTKQNVLNTFTTLLEMGIIPVVNENDTVAIDELVGANFGDNDTLSAIVASFLKADLLIMLTDIDGLYDADPRGNPEARLIPEVREIDDALFSLAGDSGSNRGTGGMVTKLHAAAVAQKRRHPHGDHAGGPPGTDLRPSGRETGGDPFSAISRNAGRELRRQGSAE